jgi:UDP-3-O-[3-hydroxymyristoyl] glucosamine N-acyltransferase
MRLAEIAERIGCDLRGDGDIEVRGVAPIESAGPDTLTFLANPRYRRHLRATRAAAVILAADDAEVAIPSLRARDPYLAFAKALELFYVPPALPEGVHPTAVVAASASIGSGARIGAYCVVGENCHIGDNACIDAHVVIYSDVNIGRDFRCFARVTIRERVVIGDRVILQSGCVIGGDGFGYVPTAGGVPRKIVQAGGVVLEDDVEIGANATVDRATMGNTVIRRGAKLDNLVMVAHGCRVGESSFLAAQSGLAGGTDVGRLVRMGGQVGAAGHLSIGDRAQIAAQSGIANDVAPGAIVGGYPAADIRVWRRVTAALPRLPELLRRVRRLEARLGSAPAGDASP